MNIMTLQLKEIETLRGHTDRVWCIAWNPASGAGRVPAVFASCGADKKVIIWEQDRATASFQCKFDEPAYKLLLKKDHAHDKDINSVQWCSQDNSCLASTGDDGTVKIW
ncbi:protein CIA1-like [Henckelia pumila]|uniref:protein CIA1-like n=1 Tax=Henckelia pumila TaxID=405737 RepID=UPI003C6E0E36